MEAAVAVLPRGLGMLWPVFFWLRAGAVDMLGRILGGGRR